MIGRERVSVEEGRVDGERVAEGNERGRNGPRHGRREGKRGRRKRAEEGLSEEGMEQLREQGGGKLQGMYPDEDTGQVHNREPGRSQVTI